MRTSQPYAARDQILLVVILAIFAVLIIGVLLVFGWGVGVNNTIVRKNQAVEQAWSQVQNVYQRRLDLIPNLVATVKGAASHEMQTLVGVVSQRANATRMQINAADPQQFQQFAQQQAQLSGALGRLLAVAENYPQIRANENFLTLQSQLEGTENRISVERGRFNETVQDYNTTVLTFPGSLVAGFRNFKPRPYFTAEVEAQKAPRVDFGPSAPAVPTPSPAPTAAAPTPAPTVAAAAPATTATAP